MDLIFPRNCVGAWLLCCLFVNRFFTLTHWARSVYKPTLSMSVYQCPWCLCWTLFAFFIHVKFITSVWKGRICITYVCVSFHRSFIHKRHALLWLLVLLAKTCTICLPLFEDSHFFFVLFCKIIIEDIQILNLRFPSPSKHPPPCLFAWFGRCAVSTNCLSGCWWVPLRFSLSIILTTTEHVHRPKQKACPQGYIYRCG